MSWKKASTTDSFEGSASVSPATPDTETVNKAWDKLMEPVRQYSDTMDKGWKDDIDTLLVFAGLFSAVVTALTVESYRRLAEDPTDRTVALLTQISRQLGQPGLSIPTAATNSNFEPTSSDVRINSFWFASLLMSLTASLFALLCKQWLREYQRVPDTTPRHALSLYQMKEESLYSWGIPRVLTILPVLLELALLLFFAGLLEFVWTLRALPLFIVCTVVIGLTCAVYFITTILPALSLLYAIIRGLTPDCDHLSPFKSPQAWAAMRAMFYLLSLPSFIDRLYHYARYYQTPWNTHSRSWITNQLRRFTAWTSFDRSFLESPTSPRKRRYELQGLRWLLSSLRDVPRIAPAFEVILESYTTCEAVLVFLEHQEIFMWERPSTTRVLAILHSSTDPDAESAPHFSLGLSITRALATRISIFSWNLTRYMVRAVDLVENPQTITLEAVREFCDEALLISRQNVQEKTNVFFTPPFFLVQEIWAHPDPQIREYGLFFLFIYRAEWLMNSRAVDFIGMDACEYDRRYAMLAKFTEHLRQVRTSPHPRRTALLRPDGLAFLKFIHGEVANFQFRRKVSTINHPRLAEARMAIVDRWNEAMQDVQACLSLPHEYFAPERSTEV